MAAAEWTGDLEAATHHAKASNPVCGDDAEIWLRVRDGVIEDVRWKARGCPPTIAALDVLAERIRGMTTARASALEGRAIAEALPGLPPTSRHACELAVTTLRQALNAR